MGVDEPEMPYTNRNLCAGPNRNIGFHVYMEWGFGAEYKFEGGFDFGWGGAVRHNDKWIFIKESDVWWGGSDWRNGAVWRFDIPYAHNNVLEIFGSEGCCDGA